MHKCILIFKNITDFGQFEQYVKENLVPFVLKMEGIINMQLTTLIPIDDIEASRLNKFQFLLEVYFEQIENVEVLIKNREGIQFLKELSNHPIFDVSMYMGNETNVSPDR